MKGAPTLLTDRLDLRLPVATDLMAMAEIVAHPETGRYLGHAFDPADHFMRFTRNAGSWLLYGYGSFIVRLRGSQEVIAATASTWIASAAVAVSALLTVTRMRSASASLPGSSE